MSQVELTLASKNLASCSPTPSISQSHLGPFNLHFGFQFQISEFDLSVF